MLYSRSVPRVKANSAWSEERLARRRAAGHQGRGVRVQRAVDPPQFRQPAHEAGCRRGQRAGQPARLSGILAD
ncbi:hypothetical protein GCM10009863_50610 [Streptomyces axinellae]|uniref:Uncharacterized protein n=1 Tax=Streptomyces axinellae TaxID=552788 RepID=A0ABN3QL00_9ACTN